MNTQNSDENGSYEMIESKHGKKKLTGIQNSSNFKVLATNDIEEYEEEVLDDHYHEHGHLD